MNDLDIAKAIAGLEGVEVTFPMNSNTVLLDVTSTLDIREYNPITDLALNCMLRDKYGVEIEYDPVGLALVSMYTYCIDGSVVDTWYASADIEDINLAVCECILKSKGLWEK